MALQQVCTTFTSGVTESLKDAMAAHKVIKKLYDETNGGSNNKRGLKNQLTPWESAFLNQLKAATTKKEEGGGAKEVEKELIWKDSMDDIKAKVAQFYNK